MFNTYFFLAVYYYNNRWKHWNGDPSKKIFFLKQGLQSNLRPIEVQHLVESEEIILTQPGILAVRVFIERLEQTQHLPFSYRRTGRSLRSDSDDPITNQSKHPSYLRIEGLKWCITNTKSWNCSRRSSLESSVSVWKALKRASLR